MIVNSWNEWDPLREVIVGSARGAADIGYEPALAPYFPTAESRRVFSGQRVPSVLVDEAERQLDHFIALLDRRGSTVRRPEPIDHAIAAETPDWKIAG
jgi:glycine amidinotransferase